MWNWLIRYRTLLIFALIGGLVLFSFSMRQYTAWRKRQQAASKTPEKEDKSASFILRVAPSLELVGISLALALIILAPEDGEMPILTAPIKAWLLEHGLRILLTLVAVFLIQRLIQRVVPQMIEQSGKARSHTANDREELSKRTQTLTSITVNTLVGMTITVATLMILDEIGLKIGPLLAGAGVVGVAVGFGAQSLIKDLLNGLFIILEDQYRKGDVVKIADIAGFVVDVNLRHTVLRDLDGIMHTIPNGAITTASNYTKEFSRVNLNVTISYDSDLNKAMSIINQIGKELAQDTTFGSMITAAPRALRVDNFSSSGVEIKILGETKPIKQWDVTGELRKRVKQAFDEAGIEIAMSQMKIHLNHNAARSTLTCKSCLQPNLPENKFCANCGASLSRTEK
ncbi:MAG: mechanosensitive ion channel domain-containing protein [Chloroflexota bacterium]